MTIHAQQTLIFDADDTLWECNKYFEEIITEFIADLNHAHMTPEEVRLVLDEFERTNGYGAKAFATSLVETYHKLAATHDDAARARIHELGLRLLEQRMETIPGVVNTLSMLQPHHTLYLFTKGEEEEQRLKIARSEVAHFFELHIVTHDKTVDTYLDLIDSLNLDKEHTWMIGNSLKSDIQPALEAGLNAIYVPNPHTWHMEHLDFNVHPSWRGRSIELESISELTHHFQTTR